MAARRVVLGVHAVIGRHHTVAPSARVRKVASSSSRNRSRHRRLAPPCVAIVGVDRSIFRPGAHQLDARANTNSDSWRCTPGTACPPRRNASMRLRPSRLAARSDEKQMPESCGRATRSACPGRATATPSPRQPRRRRVSCRAQVLGIVLIPSAPASRSRSVPPMRAPRRRAWTSTGFRIGERRDDAIGVMHVPFSRSAAMKEPPTALSLVEYSGSQPSTQTTTAGAPRTIGGRR